MKYTRQNMPCVVYSVLAVVIVVIYVVITSKSSMLARSAIASQGSKHSGVTMHVYDVAVVYGIITLALNLLMVGAVLYLLCAGGHSKLAYSIISLITVLWVTYIVVVLQSMDGIEHEIASTIRN
tara:strand:- start:89 stop:460 length:372 start_codon:yes stop_codon:yes gene_type:complete